MTPCFHTKDLYTKIWTNKPLEISLSSNRLKVTFHYIFEVISLTVITITLSEMDTLPWFHLAGLLSG